MMSGRQICSMLCQKLQNRAARIMTGANYDVRSTDLLHAMSWKNLNDRHKMNKSVLMFKVVFNKREVVFYQSTKARGRSPRPFVL